MADSLTERIGNCAGPEASLENRCLIGDCRKLLPTLPSELVHCCVTSPPYWGLRDYGTAKWDGGDSECDHLAPPRGGRNPETAAKQLTSAGTLNYQYTGICGKCGAERADAQLGLEPTPQEYISNMVAVFREVRRVLREDGTLWLNLGDSYAGSRTGEQGATGQMADREVSKHRGNLGITKIEKGLKPKDLVGIPWRVAFALQADGWYLRQDIIWSKPNPMPESVRDRCTKAHEYLFLLAKSERYYFDNYAISEEGSGRTPGNREYKYDGLLGHETKHGILKQADIPQLIRNKRSVWTVATQPYSEAHFATFPPTLIEPCILAGCPSGGVVLDPFIGSGTVAEVAQNLGRQWLGIELNPEYAKMLSRRSAQQGMQFA